MGYLYLAIAIISMLLIVSGVVVMHVFSNSVEP